MFGLGEQHEPFLELKAWTYSSYSYHDGYQDGLELDALTVLLQEQIQAASPLI